MRGNQGYTLTKNENWWLRDVTAANTTYYVTMSGSIGTEYNSGMKQNGGQGATPGPRPVMKLTADVRPAIPDVNELSVGDTFYLGTYPSTIIYSAAPTGNLLTGFGPGAVNAELVEALNALLTDDGWQTETYGEGSRYGNWQYQDVVYQGVKYRYADKLAGHKNWDVSENYWFRFDPVKWRVLEVGEGTALVMAETAIDSVPWAEGTGLVTWKDSLLRSYMNSTMLGTLFTGTEQAVIANSYPEEAVEDKLYVLSREEFNAYTFPKVSPFVAYTRFRGNQGYYAYSHENWWLRDVTAANTTYYVTMGGSIETENNAGQLNNSGYGASPGPRPVMRLGAAVGHLCVWGEWVSTATCTEPGTRTRACTVEGCTKTQSEAVPAAGHQWGNVLRTKEPNCTEEGIGIRTCAVCGETTTITYSPLGHGEYLPTVVAPTCTEPGYTRHTCEFCDDYYDDTPVAALGHDYGTWEVTVQPTCTQNGLQTKACTRCGDTVSESLEALGHDYSAWEVTVHPTCTQDGLRTKACSRCNDTVNESIDALGHDYAAVVTAPTCLEGGYTTYTCTRDASHTYTDTPTAATGHYWNSGVITKQPTCTENGAYTYTCTKCAKTNVISIAMTPHTLVTAVTDPTYDNYGWRVESCTVCGYESKRERLSKLPIESYGVKIEDPDDVFPDGFSIAVDSPQYSVLDRNTGLLNENDFAFDAADSTGTYSTTLYNVTLSVGNRVIHETLSSYVYVTIPTPGNFNPSTFIFGYYEMTSDGPRLKQVWTSNATNQYERYTVNGDGTLSFWTNHFSLYGFTEYIPHTTHTIGQRERSGTQWVYYCTECHQLAKQEPFSFFDWILFIVCFGWIWM
ncbi:MAG: DUF6273 domain-containing protein [Oscillospiraceae bacterium]|nr:DUF6273 domain-containing protein [Oscillospiraceae bacterium]